MTTRTARRAVSRAPRGRAFRAVAAMTTRDLLRNPLTGLAMFFLFGWMLILYVGMWLAFTVIGDAPVVTVTGDDEQLVERVTASLARSGIDTAGTPNTTISLSPDGAVAQLTEKDVATNPLWIGLRDAGIPATDILVLGVDGDQRLDPLREYLGVTAMLGISSVALMGTTVQIVGMRERGLLRLLGTTPLRRSTFLLAQLPTRLVIIGAQVAIVAAIAVAGRYVDGLDALRLAVTLILGTALMLALCLLLAARPSREQPTQQGMTMLTILLVFASGGLIPTWMIPEPVQVVLNALPTTWIAQAAAADLTGLTPFFPVPVLWAMMAAAAVVSVVLAARWFRWDQTEETAPTRAPRTKEETA